LDTTSATTPTLKYYDGADDISLATIDHTANTVNWLDSTVSITGLSTTATGTVLTLSDSATTSTVNLIIDNDKEIRFREATANGTNYVSLSAPASLSADLTFTLPATDGTAGQVLQTNGSGVLSFATVGGLAWQTIVTGATLSAVAGRGYWINTTSNACTVTLPASATNGDTIVLADYARKWGTNKITINQNSLNFQGYTSPNPEYNTSGQSVTLVYSGATQGWIPTVDDDVTLETPQTYSIDFLVVAGGGAGGGGQSGGGGAGGFRTSTQTVNGGTVITVTVGDGGASPASDVNGGNGSNSSISGSGLTTITSAGGGGGGHYLNASTPSGGSGGGGGIAPSPQAGGSGNTPSTSPSQGNNGGGGGTPYAGDLRSGGGGGAGAVGQAGGSGGSPSGNGGDGTASSITGSSVTRAGGGGGSNFSGTVCSGGAGGGGNGGLVPATGSSGTANTGGGGGGMGAGGAGGKGVVILSLPTANYSSTSTGSPTVTTSGSNTILQFNGSGSYTA
jgi:hypothetical protein